MPVQSQSTPFDAAGTPRKGARDLLRLARWFVPYAGRVAFALVASVLSAAAAVLVPVVLSRVVIDGILLRRPHDALPDYGQRTITAWISQAVGITPLFAATVLYALWVLSWAGFGYAYRCELARASQHALADLRRSLLAHVEHLAPSFFDRVTGGQILTRMTADIDSLSELLVGVATLLGELLPLGLAAATMLALDPVLFVELSPLMIAIGLVLTLFRRLTGPLYKAIRSSLSRIQEHLHEELSAMDTVQAYARERISIARHADLGAEQRRLETRAILAETIQNPIFESMQTFALALLLWSGGRHVGNATITLGSLVIFLQFTDLLFRPLGVLSEQWSNWLRGAAACERVFRLLDWQERTTMPVRPVQLPKHVRGAIEIRDLSFGYRAGDEVLRRIRLCIEPGERLALVGQTGSGKSTLSRLLCRMYDAPPNSIFLDGTDLMHLTPAALRQHVGMIFQDFHLFPGTVEYNIALGNPKVNRAAVKRAAAAVQALSFIEALPRGFDTVLDGGGRQLSQGQRQLLAFARVLALNPPVLILDEATAHVDPATEAAIGSALAGAATGRTCVVIAHRLNAVREVDRIAVLERGELVELGTHAQLLARRGAYRALYDAQMRSYEPGS